MTGNKATYTIAAAIFAGLSMIAVTGLSSNSVENIQVGNEQEAYAQYGSIVGIRQNVITVSGAASTSSDPDKLVVSFGLETQATTASEATQENASRMTDVVNAVMALGITEDEISTSGFQVSPVYDREYKFITGYRTSNVVTVQTDKLDMASQIIDTAVGAGANRVNNIFFTLSDELRKTLSDQLIDEAVKDAKTKAELALQPLEKKIIGVKSVSLEHFAVPQPFKFDRAVAEAVPVAAPTPIFESEQQVSMSVNVIFLIG
ncbi:MAG: SIMPL domain-containing protein [Nitrososphaerales archaeon]